MSEKTLVKQRKGAKTMRPLRSPTCVVQHRRFDLRRNRPVERIFHLEFTKILTTLPTTFSDESTYPGLHCAHVQSVAWAQKVLTSMS